MKAAFVWMFFGLIWLSGVIMGRIAAGLDMWPLLLIPGVVIAVIGGTIGFIEVFDN